jgi:hypothetical protein
MSARYLRGIGQERERIVRDEELAMIARHIEQRGVNWCPLKFTARNLVFRNCLAAADARNQGC